MAKIKHKHKRQVQQASSRRIRYRVRNGQAYDRALVRRGEITLWFDRCLVKAWKPPKSNRRGASRRYSEAVIVCVLTLKAVFHLSNREVEGLVRSLLKLMRVRLPTPDHTTLSRRAGQLEVPLSPSASREPLQVLLDSSGVQIVGPSAWREWQNARWHQAQRGRQDFRKIHLALNAENGEIVAVEVTDKFEHDKEQVAPLLAQIPGEIDQVIADGNYDFNSARETIETHRARDIIPPRVDAVILPHVPRPERDRAIRRIKQLGDRTAWKREVGYHRRSLVEAAFSRMKRRLGQRLSSREKSRQIQEGRIWCCVLNRMAQVGLPKSMAVRAA